MGFNPPSPVATAKQLLSQRKASCTLTALGDDADDELDGAGKGWAISRPEMTLRLPTTNTAPPSSGGEAEGPSRIIKYYIS